MQNLDETTQQPSSIKESMDVVWLKRDVRLHDHGPFATASFHSKRPFMVLFLLEPNQLQEHCFHGSHVLFQLEGLLDLEKKLQQATHNVDSFQKLTVCYANALETFQYLHQRYGIARILAHEETGNWASYQRDRQVRRWCKETGIKILEMQQTGVKRRLKSRDDFSKHFRAFVEAPRYPTPTSFERLFTPTDVPNSIDKATHILDDIQEIPPEHKHDRPNRQTGGEAEALAHLDSFLAHRYHGYSRGISSPLTSWNSCSRLSVYLTWGHISIRQVLHQARQCQTQLAQPSNDRKSLAAFLSRMHWRAHFIQKLEDDPRLEFQEMCPAYRGLREQEFSQEHYGAWSTGQTGFPFVDACMRCLHRHGWINFRMRAMLVSFAAYNLWLDWRRFAPHLARLFLDYEPGIHYPQLQMQSGTTGINAMRVYSVTKQGKDQDPTGKFIRRYVPELERVPNEYIHEPWRMPIVLQESLNVVVGVNYPERIVDEQQSARDAKNRVSAVRKLRETKQQAQEVYQKHGSRKDPNHCEFRDKKIPNQPSIISMVQQMRSSDDKKAVQNFSGKRKHENSSSTTSQDKSVVEILPTKDHGKQQKKTHSWECRFCTYLNENKPHALVCSVCESPRYI